MAGRRGGGGGGGGGYGEAEIVITVRARGSGQGSGGGGGGNSYNLSAPSGGRIQVKDNRNSGFYTADNDYGDSYRSDGRAANRLPAEGNNGPRMMSGRRVEDDNNSDSEDTNYGSDDLSYGSDDDDDRRRGREKNGQKKRLGGRVNVNTNYDSEDTDYGD